MAGSRNSPCPCGSGRKYKRCCLSDDNRARRAARFDDAVGQRMQQWSVAELGGELEAALEEFDGPDPTMSDADVEIFAAWFHNDRRLADGCTPAQRYAARRDLPEAERVAAARIGAARLGVHRVLAVEPGASLLLEDLADRRRVPVRSENVSRDAVRWDILIGRVMEGEPSTLWGPTRTLAPADEPELLAEVERLAGGGGDGGALERVLSERPLAVMRFLPPRSSAVPSFFTLEGDPAMHATAAWPVRDVAAAAARLRALGGLAAGAPVEVDLTAPRAELVASRPELPPGAIVLESGTVDDFSSVPMATLRLEGRRLLVEAMSAQRLDRAIEIVGLDLGDVVDEISERNVVPLDAAAGRPGASPGTHEAEDALDIAPAEERRLLAGAMTERMRCWLDEPHRQLDGRTPRETAASDGSRSDLVRIVRGIENGVERARRGGEPFADVAWIRDELGLGDDLRAA